MDRHELKIASAKLCVQDQGKRGKATSLGIGGNIGITLSSFDAHVE